uniref:Uncharacterized protein n=1 Tax=Rhizophagus irregularis (strain DAOM 181602 / DAOM 197198 / MUCL 43194) TaxID=747089 RepID=U9UTX7_RHIID
MYFLKKGEQDRLSFESIFISLYIIAERRLFGSRNQVFIVFRNTDQKIRIGRSYY